MAINGNRTLGEQLSWVCEEARGLSSEAGEILAGVRQLMQLERQLAQAEMDEAMGHARQGTMFGVVAGVFGLIGLIFVFTAIMFGLDTVLPDWAAALITGGIGLLLAALAGLMARGHLKSFSPVPRRAMKNMREDMEWARSQTKLNSR